MLQTYVLGCYFGIGKTCSRKIVHKAIREQYVRVSYRKHRHYLYRTNGIMHSDKTITAEYVY